MRRFVRNYGDVFIAENQLFTNIYYKMFKVITSKVQLEILKNPIIVIFTSSNGEY